MTIQNGQVANANEVIKSIGVTTAQLAYFGITTDSTNWTNENYLGADIFTDSNGAKNTIDTGNSTARWMSNNYFVLDYTDEASGDTTHNPDSLSNPENAFDGNDGTYCETTSTGSGARYLGKIFSSARFIGIVRVKASVGGSVSTGPISTSISLETYNGSSWSTVTTLASHSTAGTSSSCSYDAAYFLNSTVQGIRIAIKISTATASAHRRWYTIEYGDFDSSSSVETNTIMDEFTPKSIVVYGKAEIPTDTNITIDVSDDGGSNWDITNQSINYMSDSNSFYLVIDTTSLSGSDLALKFNLSTTDSTKTPKLYGYSIAITDS